jgi:hypothetical protein
MMGMGGCNLAGPSRGQTRSARLLLPDCWLLILAAQRLIGQSHVREHDI